MRRLAVLEFKFSSKGLLKKTTQWSISVIRPRISAATSVEWKKHVTKAHTLQNIKGMNKEI